MSENDKGLDGAACSPYWRRVALIFRVLPHVKCWQPTIGGRRVAAMFEAACTATGFLLLCPVLLLLIVANYLLIPFKPFWLARRMTPEAERNVRAVYFEENSFIDRPVALHGESRPDA